MGENMGMEKIIIYVPRWLKVALEDKAKELDMSLNEYIRLILERKILGV